MTIGLPTAKKSLAIRNKSLNVIWAVIVPSVMLLLILTAPTGAQGQRVIYEKESRYHYIRVADDNAVRTLYFTKGPGAHIQSAIDLNSPDKHVLEYTPMIFAGLAFVRQPQRILVVGLGGGIIPATFTKHFPSAKIDVVEIDEEIVHVAGDFFNFHPSGFTKIIVSDGRVYVRRAKHNGTRYDIIVLDAFNGSYIPSHLTTKEFLQEVFFILKDGGCVVSNIHHVNKLYEYQQRTYSEVALQNYVFEGKSNAIVVSTQQRERLSGHELKERLAQLQHRHQFSFDLNSMSRILIEHPTWKVTGDILTDDFSPVNVLKIQKR